MGTRIHWADHAKALGITLVFLGHFIEKGGYVHGNMQLLMLYKWIYAFHMPFFFLLAGYFYHDYQGRFGQFVVSKAKSRLVPVVFFVALSLLCWQKPEWWIVTDYTREDQMALVNLLWYGRPIANWPCWFFISLFFVELVAAELIPFLNKLWEWLLSLAMVFGAATILAQNPTELMARLGMADGFWCLQQAVMALFFYLLGQAYRRHVPAWLPERLSVSRSYLVICVSLVLLVVSFHRNFEGGRGAVNMSATSYGDPLWFLMAALAGSLLLMHLGQHLKSNVLLSSLGKHTVPLVGINGWMLSFLYPYLWSRLVPAYSGWSLFWIAIACALATLLLAMPFAWCLNRYVPWLVGQWK